MLPFSYILLNFEIKTFHVQGCKGTQINKKPKLSKSQKKKMMKLEVGAYAGLAVPSLFFYLTELFWLYLGRRRRKNHFYCRKAWRH